MRFVEEASEVRRGNQYVFSALDGHKVESTLAVKEELNGKLIGATWTNTAEDYIQTLC